MSVASIILPLLTERPSNVKEVLNRLHSSSALINSSGTTELNLLAKKALNYANSRDVYTKWVGCHLIRAVARNPLILTNHGADFMTCLIKIINLVGSIPTALYNVAADTILTLCLAIKGKSTLTRAVVTPNLPAVISVLVKNISFDNVLQLENTVSILSSLIRNHPTIFRQYATAYETKLVEILASTEVLSFSSSLRGKIVESFVVLSLVNANPALQWRVLFSSVLEEVQSVVNLLFQDFIALNEEHASAIEKDIETLHLSIDDSEKNIHNKSLFKLAPLKIDLNELCAVNQLVGRFQLLTDILVGFITTPLNNVTINLPLGLLVNVSATLLNVSTAVHGFKSDLLIGNINLKSSLNFAFFTIQLNGIRILNSLLMTVGQQMLVYFSRISKITDLVVPTLHVTVNNPGLNKSVQKKVLDRDTISSQRHYLVQVIEFATNLLQLLANGDLQDFSFVLKIIDMSVIMVGDMSYGEILEKNDTKPRNKKTNKSKHSVELSDFLSDPDSLKIKVNKPVVSAVLKFYTVVLKNVSSLSLTQLIKIQNFTLLYAVKSIFQTSVLECEVKSLLETFVLYQNRNEKFNVLPIVSNLLRLGGQQNNELLSLLLNPRFPVTNKRELEHYDHEEDAAEEKGEKEVVVPDDILQSIREQLTNEITYEVSKKYDVLRQRDLEEHEAKRRKLTEAHQKQSLENNTNVWSAKIEPRVESEQEQPSVDETTEIIKTTTEVTVKNGDRDTTSKQTDVQVAKDDESDSDFEIPDIEIGSSDEED